MSTSPRSRRRSIGSGNLVSSVDLLEARVLPAGNVSVSFDGADLVITGDKSSNSVQILYELGGNVLVRGLDGTRINSGTADFIAAVGTHILPGDLSVNLQKGNDLFWMTGVQVGTVAVVPTAGNDTTVLREVTATSYIAVGAPFGLTNDPGNDHVAILDTTATDVHVSLGDGHDVAALEGVVASQSILVLMGAGNDFLGANVDAAEDFIVGMGAGSDVMFGSVTAGGLRIDMESGDDLLMLFDIDQNDPTRLTSINLGKGNDRATLGAGSPSVQFDSFLSVSGSAGTDKFFLLPGATLNAGLIVQEVESTAPYLAYADPAVQKQYSGVFRRAQDFSDFLATLP